MGGFSALFLGVHGQQCVSSACSEGAPRAEGWSERDTDGAGSDLAPPNPDDEP